jgi:hypothetical protein
MSLSNAEVIDLVVLTPDKKQVALIIVDGGDISEGNIREEALHKKLLSYLNFVASGQFVKLYPEHADRGVFIKVMCYNTAPTDGMMKIKGIRDHDRQESFLPVEIESKVASASNFTKPEVRPNPRWKFWR